MTEQVIFIGSEKVICSAKGIFWVLKTRIVGRRWNAD